MVGGGVPGAARDSAPCPTGEEPAGGAQWVWFIVDHHCGGYQAFATRLALLMHPNVAPQCLMLMLQALWRSRSRLLWHGSWLRSRHILRSSRRPRRRRPTPVGGSCWCAPCLAGCQAGPACSAVRAPGLAPSMRHSMPAPSTPVHRSGSAYHCPLRCSRQRRDEQADARGPVSACLCFR